MGKVVPFRENPVASKTLTLMRAGEYAPLRPATAVTFLWTLVYKNGESQSWVAAVVDDDKQADEYLEAMRLDPTTYGLFDIKDEREVLA